MRLYCTKRRRLRRRGGGSGRLKNAKKQRRGRSLRPKAKRNLALAARANRRSLPLNRRRPVPFFPRGDPIAAAPRAHTAGSAECAGGESYSEIPRRRGPGLCAEACRGSAGARGVPRRALFSIKLHENGGWLTRRALTRPGCARL